MAQNLTLRERDQKKEKAKETERLKAEAAREQTTGRDEAMENLLREAQGHIAKRDYFLSLTSLFDCAGRCRVHANDQRRRGEGKQKISFDGGIFERNHFNVNEQYAAALSGPKAE
jgi:hypothetical protein